MTISKWSQKCRQRWVCSTSFFKRNEHGDLLFSLACWIQHYISCSECKYALIGKLHHTVRHCFNMFMRILTLNHSASFGITSSRIILEQGTLASHSLFKHNNVSEAIFSISIMDLGKMCEIQSWPATFFAVAMFTVVKQCIQRCFVFDFSSFNFIWFTKSHLV